MKINPLKLSSLRLSSTPKQLPEMIKYAAENGCGIEVRYPVPIEKFDKGFNACVNKLAKTLKGFNNKLSLHGFSNDINPVSEDPAIRKISQKRYNQSLKIANAINADTVIFHTGYNPYWRTTSYDARTKNDLINFWKEFVKKFEKSNKIAVLENSLETEPDFILDIVKAIDSPNLKLCLDTGHVKVNSKIPLESWVDKSKKFLHHIHLHNNNGLQDEHRAFVDGKINFDKTFAKIEEFGLSPNIVFEVKSMKETKKSLEGFRKLFGTQTG